MKSLTLALVLITQLSFSQSSLVLVNSKWVKTTGLPGEYDWSASTTDASGYTYIVGNTQTSTEGTNILLSKFDRKGNLVWEVDWNHGSSVDDYGTCLDLDGSGNIIVGGASEVSQQNMFDFALLKFNTNGSLIWSTGFNGPGSGQDVISDLLIDSNDNIIVIGGSEGTTSLIDYSTQKYNSSGVMQWEARYDYTGYYDAPVGLELVNDNPVVTGGSGDSWTNWDFATVRYDSNGNEISSMRSSNPGLGFDQPFDISKDSNDNIYICGQYEATQGNLDIKVLKLDEDLNEVWTYTEDVNGKADVANGVTVDDVGQVYITGYQSDSNEKKHMFVKRLSSSGTLDWSEELDLGSPSKESIGYRILNNGSELIFCATIQTDIYHNIATGSYTQSGDFKWMHEIDNPSGHDQPWTVRVDAFGNILTSGIYDENGTVKYVLAKYQVHEVDKTYNDPVTPSYVEDELIVRFHPSILDSLMIWNTGISFGTLDQVMNLSDFNSFQQATSYDMSKVVARKLVKDLTPAHTTSISRMGEPVNIPPFWSSYVLEFESPINESSMMAELSSLPTYIRRVEPNVHFRPLVCETESHPEVVFEGLDEFIYLYYSDDELPFQESIMEFGGSDEMQIEVTNAWCQSRGEEFIRVGVFGRPINYEHDDFSITGANTLEDSKVTGRNYLIDGFADLTTTDIWGNDHETKAAGIIGALRNNGLGIAGIAGGDMRWFETDNPFGLTGLETGNSSTGCQLYSFAIADQFGYDLSELSPAVIEAASGIGIPEDWGDAVHIINNSWRIFEDDDGDPFEYPWRFEDMALTMGEVYEYAWRNQVLIVSSRGNEGDDEAKYPASLNDDWILSVGASGFNNGVDPGEMIETPYMSSYGKEVDLVAPGDIDYVHTTANGNGNVYEYKEFDGTSAAAPHVSGVSALMLSYYNDENSVFPNLSPEDVEMLLQSTCDEYDDIVPAGYDQYNGWGHLSADQVMEVINTDQYKVQHHITTSSNYTVDEQSVNLTLLHNYDDVDNGIFLDAGNYKVDVYRVDVNQSYPYDPDYVFYDGWTRSASTTSWAHYYTDFLGDKYLFPDRKAYLDGMSLGWVDMHGFVYYIIEDDQQNPVQLWLPTDLTQSQTLSFTAHLQLDPVTDISENNNHEFSVFPNPSSSHLTIQTPGNEQIGWEIADAQGRVVLSGQGSSQLLVGDLAKGLYIVYPSVSSDITPVKFIHH